MKFHFDLGTVIAVVIFAVAVGFAGPSVIQLLTFQDQIKVKQSESALAAAKNEREAALVNADTQARIQAASQFVALELKEKQAKIDALLIEANGKADAAVIAAQGQADRERALGQSLIMIAATFLLGLAAVVAWRAIGAWAAVRSTRQIIETVAQRGGRHELPNGHVVTFEPRPTAPLLTESTQTNLQMQQTRPHVRQRARTKQMAQKDETA